MNTDLYGISIERAVGGKTNLAAFQGQVLLIVNVASRCGLTPQYDALEQVQKKYAERGFTVLGFPANEFGAQEPGTNAEIQSFCRLNFGVTFPVFAKLAVKGPEQHPLYRYLTSAFPEVSKKGSPLRKVLRKVLHSDNYTGESGEISWNFEKFLIDRQGGIVARFAPDVVPDDPRVVEAIEALL